MLRDNFGTPLTNGIDAISHWDELTLLWRAEPGQWHIQIGKDAQTMCAKEPFTVPSGFQWKGV